jgi:2-dehydropantoate 2-reductase
MTEPILIWGAGAIGGTLGAYWRAPASGRLRRRVAEHVRACRTTGCEISGPVESSRSRSRRRAARGHGTTGASCSP